MAEPHSLVKVKTYSFSTFARKRGILSSLSSHYGRTETLEHDRLLGHLFQFVRYRNSNGRTLFSIKLRIEAQGKYLQSVLEKAQETLGRQNLSAAGLEAAKVQLSELVSKVSNECLTTEFTGLEEFPSLLTLQAHTSQLADCSMDSCLTSCEGSQKEQERHNTSMGLRPYYGSSSLFIQHSREDIRLEQPQFTWCADMDKPKVFSSQLVKESDKTHVPVHRDPSLPDIVSQTPPKEQDDDFQLEPKSKRHASQQQREKQSNGFAVADITARLDLNARNNDEAAPSGKEFDLNDFSWS